MTPGLQRTTTLSFAVAPLLLVVLFVLNDGIPLPLRLIVAAVAIIAAISPAAGLLGLAALGPFAPVVAELFGAPPTLRLLEAAGAALLAGWLLRGTPARLGGARLVRTALALLAAAVVASAAALLLRLALTRPGDLVDLLYEQSVLRWLAPDRVGIGASVHLLVGLGVFAATTALTADNRRLSGSLVRLLIAGGAGTAGLTLLLASGIGSPQMLAWQSRFALERFAGHITDVNAAGSYFAMVLAVAAVAAWRASGAARAGWGAAAAMIGIGLAFSGSRSAYAAIGLVALGGVLWGIARSRLPHRWTIVGGAAAAVLLLLAVAVVGVPLSGVGLREQFNETSARMIAAAPVLGVGIGQYYGLSLLALTPELAWLYATENAHNYFLQVAAELGLVGLAPFVALVAGSLWRAVRPAREGGTVVPPGALAAGAVAYLITCLTGHPFLVLETAVPFWIVLGLAAGTSPAEADSPAPGSEPVRRAASWALLLALAISVPFRTGAPEVRLPPARDGLGPPARDRDGRLYRSGQEYFAVYVGPEVTEVRIPLRLDPARRGRPLTVGDQIPGWAQHSTEVGADWTVLDLTLPGAPLGIPGQRINFRVYDAGGRPEDARNPGVWVGEVSTGSPRR